MVNKLESRDICLSIVSHGQAKLVQTLLQDLDDLASKQRFFVVLTLNIPEHAAIDSKGYSFPIQVIHNQQPKGFGANHNQAFEACDDEVLFFFVLNPDLRIQKDIFIGCSVLLQHDVNIGVIAPKVVNEDHELEDSVRELPTPSILFKKSLGKYVSSQEQYCNQGVCFPDWVAGMCMGFRCEAFAKLNGFDESYFLYYEDVDLCSRVWLLGLKVRVEQQYEVVHQAQRSSHHNVKYLKWHIFSITRFFMSSVYRRVKKIHQTRQVNL